MIISGADSLNCMTCAMNGDETTEIHKFRISVRRTSSTCIMEPITCDPDQDTCVKIVMRMNNGRFWIGSGCDYRKNFRHVGCRTEPVYTRSIQDGQIYERRLPQRTCVCALNLCNKTARPHTSVIFVIFLHSILLIWLLYGCR
uniref:Protein quiver n=1 Tax=Syphacia muris TaxID=451379 RepID=A0A0N5AUM3_9BILA